MRRLLDWRIVSITIFMLFAAFYVTTSIFVVRGVAMIPRFESDSRPELEFLNLPAKDVEFHSRNSKLNLKGWYVAAPDKKHTIIFVHGLGANRSSGNALLIGSVLWKNGFNVLFFDLRASGKSEGDMVSGGYFEQEDLLGAFDFVRNTGIPAGNIGVLGFSMGAATSILSASKETGIQAVVSEGTYATLMDLIRQEVELATPMPGWMVPLFQPGIMISANILYGMKLDTVTPEKAASEINYPIFLIHGTNTNTRVPLEHSIRVHKAAQKDSILWKVEGVGHVGAFDKHPNKYVERVIEYYRTRFGFQHGRIQR